MSDGVDNPESGASETQGPRAGERLAAARREQQIAVIEIAKELHLDEHKVRALERNEFDALGAPVFAKGYLKKYAQLVNINADDVLADYYQMNREAEAPPVVSSRPRPRQELSPGPWITIVVVIILAVTAYLWFTRPEAPATGTVSGTQAEIDAVETAPAGNDEAMPSVTADAPLEEAPIEDTPAADAGESLTQAVEPGSESMPGPAEPPVEETSSPVIAEGEVRVLLTYSGDCWTEVSDATGRRLFFDLGRDGRSVELSGAEPLNVLFGNPGNVEVVVNGADFALPNTDRPDQPIRLTLAGE